MRITINRNLIPLLFFVLGSNLSVLSSQVPAEGYGRHEAIETALRECPVAAIRKDEPGRTNPWTVTFAEGCAVRRALFRYVDRPRPQPMADSYKYDIAAYELSKLLGIDVVPPVVEREVEGRKGTLQVYLENCIRETDRRRKKLEPPDIMTFERDVEGLKVFMNLTYDDCYNLNDLYIHLEDWRVSRVDFSEAFAPMPELLRGCLITVCSKRLYQGLLGLNDESVKAGLGRYLNDEEMGALLIRRDLLLGKLKTLIADKGDAAVLF
jgi:hypothetical protein